ncbi:Ig-like domain-containing protein [Cloacibacillus porcorum]|uniref:Ig-like domain-containing protein n=1 Tax=Cloacibacillus porcorum TaxID=1197717 RepID=UPI00248EE405|nr:Ig-like domain-containing protein [Cloacibacillus porcorum]
MGAARNAAALTSADVVYYGAYPQSGTSDDFKVEPVLWRVLEVSGDKTALMLSEKILDGGVSFNPDYSDTDPYYSWWSESQIRKFLNGKEYVESVSADVTKITVRNPKPYSFYDKAFSAGEGGGIIKADVDNSSTRGATPGPKTTDKIFLLSYADAKNTAYGFANDDNSSSSRKAELTGYGASQGVISNTEGNKKYGYWWLHSPGDIVYLASIVYSDGNLHYNIVINGAVGLRPAFHLNLENIIFTSPAAGGKQDDLTASLYKQSYASDDKGRDEHKLTLATNTYKLASSVTSAPIVVGTSVDVTLEYSGASTGAGYHLAAVITSGDRSLYYGRIKSLETAADAAGAATFVIPEYREGEEVYIFVEGRNNNGDYKTDFAGVPVCIAGSGRTIKPLSKDVAEPRPDTKSVTVNPSELTLIIGYDKQLTASFAPEGALEAVIWSSDKPDFAAVDPVTGVVSALKAGSAKVTATAKTSGKEAFCTVTVIEKPLNPALILTPAAMTVSKGVTEKITASFRGITEQPLTWSSSKESVATVDKEGKVTAKSEGTCVITAVTKDGNYNASCEVKVTAATVVHSGGSGGCNGIGAGALALLAMLPCLLIRGKRER